MREEKTIPNVPEVQLVLTKAIDSVIMTFDEQAFPTVQDREALINKLYAYVISIKSDLIDSVNTDTAVNVHIPAFVEEPLP